MQELGVFFLAGVESCLPLPGPLPAHEGPRIPLESTVFGRLPRLPICCVHAVLFLPFPIRLPALTLACSHNSTAPGPRRTRTASREGRDGDGSPKAARGPRKATPRAASRVLTERACSAPRRRAGGGDGARAARGLLQGRHGPRKCAAARRLPRLPRPRGAPALQQLLTKLPRGDQGGAAADGPDAHQRGGAGAVRAALPRGGEDAARRHRARRRRGHGGVSSPHISPISPPYPAS